MVIPPEIQDLVDKSQRDAGSRVKGFLHPLEIVSVANDSLGELVQPLEEEGDAIIAALEEMLTRWH